jgi:glycosyltransferase involved in cell wall biosynthesis
VTPVYNEEAHLRECIESVLAQTYPNWDYAVVNNRSTDRTLEIAQEYAARDSRIRVHDNATFVDVIENYNIAFRQISPQSKYCKVVAADDWLYPDCLEKMVALAEEHPSVAMVSAFGLEGTNVAQFPLPYYGSVLPGHEVCRMRLRLGAGSRYHFGTPTLLLFRSNIVRSRHAFYNESNLHGDAEVCFEFLTDHDFGFVYQVLTFNRLREESMTSLSKSLHTYFPEALYNLLQFGPKYLEAKELTYRIRELRRAYFRFLGKQAYSRRGHEFWSYHRRKLAELGQPLSTSRIVAAAVSYALDQVLNPKRTVEEVLRRVRHKLSGSP